MMAGARFTGTGDRLGFTLIEVLVVTGILGLVLGVITACLAGGIRAWDAARTCSRLEGPVLADLALIEKDFARMAPFPGIECRGDSRQFVFPAIVRRPWDDRSEDAEAPDGIGAIRYAYDPGRRALIRKQWVFPNPEPPDPEAETLLAGLEACRFEYGAWQPNPSGRTGSGLSWVDAWTVVTNRPGGIRMEISVANGGRMLRLGRTLLSGVNVSDGGKAE